MKYIVRELQNANSTREGTFVSAKSLASVKRKASRDQLFEGTILTIETTDGRVVATKTAGDWEDCEGDWEDCEWLAAFVE